MAGKYNYKIEVTKDIWMKKNIYQNYILTPPKLHFLVVENRAKEERKMNLLKRSILYLFRKWKVSILLLLILFMVVTLTLSGIAVLNAEEQKTEEFKEATGTSFSVERNYESGGMETDEKGNTYLTSDPITDDMIEKIASVEGIKAYNATVDSISSILKDGEYLDPTIYLK